MATSTPISPFAKPPPPPRPIIVLLCATDLDDGAGHVVPVLAHEDLAADKHLGRSLDTSCQRSSTPKARYHPYPTPIGDEDSRDTPPPSSAKSSPLSTPESSEDEGTSDGETRTPVAPSSRGKVVRFSPPHPFSTRIKIPRPRGAGRKSLVELLNWESVMVDAVKKRLRVHINTYLNKSDCFTDQNKGQLDKVKMLMVGEFPILDDYEGLWPLDLMLIAQLKYTSAASKTSTTKKAVDAVRDTVASAATVATGGTSRRR